MATGTCNKEILFSTRYFDPYEEHSGPPLFVELVQHPSDRAGKGVNVPTTRCPCAGSNSRPILSSMLYPLSHLAPKMLRMDLENRRP